MRLHVCHKKFFHYNKMPVTCYQPMVKLVLLHISFKVAEPINNIENLLIYKVCLSRLRPPLNSLENVRAQLLLSP